MPVDAPLIYLAPMRGRPYHYMYEPPGGAPQHNCEFTAHLTPIADARRMRPALEREGFELIDAPTMMRDFADDGEVKSVYYPEVAALALHVTGARRAYVFDHQVRKRAPGRAPLSFGRHGDGSRPGAAGRIHNDYTEESAPRRLAALHKGAPPERFAIVNVWRTIAGPVLDTPLAVCDARSVTKDELVPADIHYAARRGEIYLVTRSPRHAWHYFPRMDRHEALVFKQYDSRHARTARFVPHGAFDLPDAPRDAPPRESIEARCLVIHE